MLKIRAKKKKLRGASRRKGIAQLRYKKRGTACKVETYRRQLLVTKAAKEKAPLTAHLFRGDYAKRQEDPSRGWREKCHENSRY